MRGLIVRERVSNDRAFTQRAWVEVALFVRARVLAVTVVLIVCEMCF